MFADRSCISAKLRFNLLTRLRDLREFFTGNGLQELLRFQKTGEGQLFRLFLVQQELAIIEPIGSGASPICQPSVEPQRALIRFRPVSCVIASFLKISKMGQGQALH